MEIKDHLWEFFFLPAYTSLRLRVAVFFGLETLWTLLSQMVGNDFYNSRSNSDVERFDKWPWIPKWKKICTTCMLTGNPEI